ncbi:hypothetical protein DLAC_06370 [Tieghemostelium lacteum]|uniref:Uncharacterized protein n=1 Tax=Tieghemostelium lacteum TaxID=361077 RepID=A0A151ZEL1_TIELA|nr:hypothetical protein DLAC_06370 [Tieghemostelium lacteum]|eukprot:KYQ92398.1 hypothetical protein DLAC_06370 [Tieghemostelium lacteum]
MNTNIIQQTTKTTTSSSSTPIFRVYKDQPNESLKVPLVEDGIIKEEIGDIKHFVQKWFNIPDFSSFNLVLQNDESNPLVSSTPLSNFAGNVVLKIQPITTTTSKWESPQDLLKWMINRYGAPKPPANETSSEMPLMGRDMVLQDIYNKVLTRYQIPERNRDNQPLLVVAGAPGIGKTRILETIGNYLHTKKDSKLPKYQININISLGNGSNWDPYSESSNPKIALCKRVLWRYFAHGHHVPFNKFCQEIESMLKETTTLDFCFSAISDHLASLDPTMQQQQILINFGIDEFQKCLFESKDVVQRRSILKAVIQSVSDLLVFLPNTMFFYNIIFAGTILEDITIIIGGSSIPYHFIPLRLLNLDEYMKISETILGTQKSNDNDIQRAIRFMGGWPRPLEILFKVIRNLTQPIKYDTTDLLTRVELELNQRYPIISIEDLLPSIIVYSVTQTVIRPHDKPQMVIPQDTPQPNERSFGDLQSFGLFSITSDNKVFLPLIFLRRYTNLNHNSPLLKSLQYIINLLEKKSSWEEWENFNCHLEIIKHQSHHYLSLKNESKSYSLGEYYKGALFFPPILASSTFSNQVATLSICSYPTSRCPENCDIDKQCQAGTAIIKNAKGGLVDMFYKAQLDIGTAYFLGNAKYTDGSTATLKTIDLDLTNFVSASKHIVETSKEQQIKFIPIVYSNHSVTTSMKKNFEDQLKKITKITEAIIVCRGTINNNNVPQPHDGFYYPFQDFIYKLKE